MGGSYKQCVDCGKRALSIATRCPGCGREFIGLPTPERVPSPRQASFLSPRVAAVVLAVAAALAVAKLGQTSGTPVKQSSIIAPDSIAGYSEGAYGTAPTAPGELLVARTWTSVRKARSRSAELEAVLLPGDTVLADSLERSWYRVTLEGEVLGYAHRSLLAPPEVP